MVKTQYDNLIIRLDGKDLLDLLQETLARLNAVEGDIKKLKEELLDIELAQDNTGESEALGDA